MAIKQFLITLFVTRNRINEVTGKIYEAVQVLKADLVKDDIQEFLSKIPEEIDQRSMVWVCITRPDNEQVTFVDGIEDGVRLQSDKQEELRTEARIMAERRLLRLEQERSEE
jgi:hypothetical protein